MRSSRRLTCGLLVCAVALSRFLCRSHYLYDIDSVNYALALDHFDTSVHQPQPPGYFLYVNLGRLARLIFHDSNSALVAVSIVASCAAAGMIYILTDCWFGRRAALFAGLIFLFSPLFWFHGTVALTYIVEAFFSSLVGYLCWRSYSGDDRFLVPSSIVLGLAAGCRQSSLLFLGPLWLLSMRRASRRQIWTSLLALAVTLSAWFIPMLRVSGGAARYFASFLALWRLVPSKDTVFNSSIAMSIARLCTIGGIVGLCFGSAFPLFFLSHRKPSGSMEIEKDRKIFTWIWIGPGLLFFIFVFLKYVNSGYLLILAPPVFAWLGFWAEARFAQAGGGRLPKTIFVAAFAATNIAIFYYAPVYCSYRSIREEESQLLNIREGLARIAASEDTLIVGFDSHFLGYRHAGYYLPQFLTVQFPELNYPNGKRVFALQNRDTRLLNRLPLERFRKFVLFPLPPGEPYRTYLEAVRQRFPTDALTSKFMGGREFLGGSTADLPFLFPTVAVPPARPYPHGDYSK